MKNQKYLWLLAIIVIAVLLFLFQKKQMQTPALPNVVTNVTAVANSTIHTLASNSIEQQPQASVADTNDLSYVHNPEYPPEIMDKYRHGLINKLQAILAVRFLKNKTPQDFYGKVVDQDGYPIADAKVDANLTLNHETDEGYDIQKYNTVTDGNGLFEFTDLQGAWLGVQVSKEGYDIEGKNQTYKGPVGGKTSPADRAIYTLWRADIHEQLITRDKSFEIVPDGRPYFINLTDGTISEHESGDLKVWIQYTNQVTQGQLYDWSAGIDVVNGGLLEVPQTAINSGFWPDPPFAMYSAPTDGYIPSFSLKSQIKGGQSGEIGNRYFYLLLKDGKEYGRMSINLFAPYGRLHPGLVDISYAINPSGSSILR